MSRENRWEDHYARRARKERWLARSVYKLEEIDRKYRLLRPGLRILDLGCYPGSWSQYSLKKVGPGGEVVGIDLRAPERLSASNFRFIRADVLALDAERMAREVGERDVLLSDLAPSTTGIAVADASRSLELAERALALGLAVLGTGGGFLCKVFEGEDLSGFRKRMKEHFKRTRTIRPSAVRKGSREVYILGQDLIMKKQFITLIADC
ncbi:MAG: RlmE family RNA methyltransferase [Deltaproteobacteria bacterium]|nr:RlmE family RNA methyltransferase [Deltaproteobacteria bacterium]